MTLVKPSYPAARTALQLDTDGAPNASSWHSALVDNTVDLADDVLVQVAFKTPGSGLASTPYVSLWVIGTADPAVTSLNPDGAASNWGPASGGASIVAATTNCIPLRPLNTPNVSSLYTSEPISIAQCFGGVMPAKWMIAFTNNMGAATGSGGAAWYLPVQAQLV